MNFIQKIFDKYDPSRYAFLYALQIMIPCLLSLFIYLYFRELDGSICIIIVLVVYLVAAMSNNYKGKIKHILIASAITFVEFIIVGNFMLHPLIFLISSFILVFCLFKFKTFSSIIYMPAILAIIIATKPNTFKSENQIIGYSIVFIMMIAMVLVFELLFTKYELKQTIRYQAELIKDIFTLCTNIDLSKIKHQSLLSRDYLYRTNILVDKVFEDDTDMFLHKISRAMAKIEITIDPSRFYFRRNKMYAHKVRRYYETYRILYRSISFMKFINEEESIINNFPIMNEYIQLINNSLTSSYNILIDKDATIENQTISASYVAKANANINNYIETIPPSLDDHIIYYLYGVKYTLNGILKLNNTLANNKFYL